MKAVGSLQLSQIWAVNCSNLEASRSSKQVKGLGLVSLGRLRLPFLRSTRLSSPPRLWRRQDSFSIRLSDSLYKPILSLSYRINAFSSPASVVPGGQPLKFPGVMVAASTGDEKNDNNRKKSGTYIEPLLLWSSAILICSILDPVVLPTEAIQIVKQRLLDFIRSLSTLLAFSCCVSSVIQQAQKLFMGSNESGDATNMGFQYAKNTLYFAVGMVMSLELAPFSSQKWVKVASLLIVLLILDGHERFADFLSSVVNHSMRPIIVNERMQTKIDGYEVSGTVEHVDRVPPTIVRGEVGEEIFIPNHKFTTNAVRNLNRGNDWHIKTHLAISHSDSQKIKNILADMRKVLEKDPRVENGEVFLDNVNPGNQALIISVSCNVKTSCFEEYLPVKEAIMLDLLGVISHHGARLAK